MLFKRIKCMLLFAGDTMFVSPFHVIPIENDLKIEYTMDISLFTQPLITFPNEKKEQHISKKRIRMMPVFIMSKQSQMFSYSFRETGTNTNKHNEETS